MDLVSALLALALSSSPAVNPTSADPPRIDGVLTPEEWRSARREALTGGGEVLLVSAGDWLYVGVRGEGRGIASLCLAAGDRVDILHASAALGTATYRLRDGEWSLERGFRWEVRDSPTAGPASRAESDEFLESHGWLGNSNRQGAPIREFKIKRPVSGGWRLGVNFLALEPVKIASWPAKMTDDCALVRLAQGDPPAKARFAPERWAKID